MNRTMLLIASILASGSIPANAIITRHDRADAEHVRYARQFERVLVHMNLEAPGKPPDGEGVLIAPTWVLTAAHVATEVKPGHKLTVAGDDYQAEAIFLHHEWDDGALHDIALVRLKSAVKQNEVARLYPNQDEIGSIVTVVGRGDFGTGASGPTGNDRQVRGATNRVESANGSLLSWRFDAPEDSSGNVTMLEGISGPGDSGGPAFAKIGGTLYVVGVSSAQSTRATGGREGIYGVTEYYVRVSHYLGWIGQVLRDNP